MFAFPALHAHAEGMQFTVEVLGGFGQNQAGIQTRVPDAAEAQRNLLDEVVDRVAFHANRLVWVEVNALLRDSHDTETGTSQSRDSNQVVGPHSVTCREGGWPTYRINNKLHDATLNSLLSENNMTQ